MESHLNVERGTFQVLEQLRVFRSDESDLLRGSNRVDDVAQTHILEALMLPKKGKRIKKNISPWGLISIAANAKTQINFKVHLSPQYTSAKIVFDKYAEVMISNRLLKTI